MTDLLSLTKDDLNQDNLYKIEVYLRFYSYICNKRKFVLRDHEPIINYLLSLVDDDMKIRLIKYHFDSNFAGTHFMFLFIKSISSDKELENLLIKIAENNKNFYCRDNIICYILRKLKTIDQNIIEYLLSKNIYSLNLIKKIEKERDDLFKLALNKGYGFQGFHKSKIGFLTDLLDGGMQVSSYSLEYYFDMMTKKNCELYFDIFWKHYTSYCIKTTTCRYPLLPNIIKRLNGYNKLHLLENAIAKKHLEVIQNNSEAISELFSDKKVFSIINSHINNNPNSKFAEPFNNYLISKII